MHAIDAEDGITLVEILISMVILGVVLTAFFEVVTGGLQSLSESNDRQDSSQLATESIERLRSLAPSEVALRVDPADPGGSVDPSTISNCTTDVRDTAGIVLRTGVLGFDPDGAGADFECEELVQSTLGAVVPALPYLGQDVGVTITTVPTRSTTAQVQDGIVRVTAVLDYENQDGPQTITRQALFSEVNRG